MNFKDPWGFSKLDVFRTCHAKFMYQFIKKLPTPGSPAMERGGEIHANVESYLNGWEKTLHPDVEQWKEAFDELKKLDYHGEQAIGLDSTWNLLPDWFDKRTWVRIKMDAYVVYSPEDLSVIDWKTGKFRVPSTDQVELYAIAGLSILPTVKKVTAEFWFLDANDTYKKEYTREELIALRPKYEKEAAAMYAESQWKPEPSSECRWCPFSKTKRGPCEY